RWRRKSLCFTCNNFTESGGIMRIPWSNSCGCRRDGYPVVSAKEAVTMTRLSLLLAAGISALAFTSAAQAADLIIEEPMVGVVEAAGGDWDGFYLGGFIGGAWGHADHANDLVAPFCPIDGCDVDLSGWLVGATIGANFAVSDGIVAGIAG